MRWTISSAVANAIVVEAGRSSVEICGLLFGGEGRIDAHRLAHNVANDPAIAFEIDPRTLIAAHRAMRTGGPAIVGCYHSHPSGNAHPSRRDADQAAADGWLWLIVGAGEVAAWRAAPNGAVHDRFDPITLLRV